MLGALLNEWQLNRPFVVGHDFGGTTVLRNHILNERTYKKIIVIDPVALSPWGSPLFKHVRKFEAAFAGVRDYIHQPVLILWGEEDKWIPVEQAHSLHQLIPNSKLVTVPQAGHLVIEERPEILISEIKDFLNRPNEN